MEQITNTIKLICLCGLGIGIINTFVSDEHRSKSVNLVTGLVFLVILIRPVISNDYKFNIKNTTNNKTNDYSYIYDSLNDEIMKNTEDNIKKELIKNLDEADVGLSGLTIKCTADSEGNVTIETIECIVNDESSMETATRILKNRVGEYDCIIVKQKT